MIFLVWFGSDGICVCLQRRHTFVSRFVSIYLIWFIVVGRACRGFIWNRNASKHKFVVILDRLWYSLYFESCFSRWFLYRNIQLVKVEYFLFSSVTRCVSDWVFVLLCSLLFFVCDWSVYCYRWKWYVCIQMFHAHTPHTCTQHDKNT